MGGKAESDKKIEKWQEKATTSNAQRTLIPYLKSRGVDKIDQLILTNTDKEHVGRFVGGDQGFPCRGNFSIQRQFETEGICCRNYRQAQTKVRSVTAGGELANFWKSVRSPISKENWRWRS